MESNLAAEKAKNYREFFLQQMMKSLVNPNDESVVKEYLNSMVDMTLNRRNVDQSVSTSVDAKNKTMEIFIHKGDLIHGLSGLPPVWFQRDEGVYFRYDSIIKEYSANHDLVYILSSDFIGSQQISLDSMMKFSGRGSKYHGAKVNYQSNSQIEIEQTPQLVDLAKSSFDNSLPTYPDYIATGPFVRSINPYGEDVLIRLGFVSDD